MNDIEYMKVAADLAVKGRGYTSPNPCVGAVVVKNSKIVGKGWHKGAGLAHAEVEAINDAGDQAAGADIYVTLEPCNHVGKTPPCTHRILKAGIKRVVVGTMDPNPYVAGGGTAFLREKGIEVTTGVLEDQCRKIIEPFAWYVQHDRTPFVTVKCASTLDGRIAASSGDSKWITNETSRVYVHRLRHEIDAILIGSGTLKNDNPSLTARIDNFSTKDPIRVILDSSLSIDENAVVLNVSSNAQTIIAAADPVCADKKKRIEQKGAQVLILPRKNGLLDLACLMKKLGAMGIVSVLIEGGSKVIHSALHAGIVNKVLFFLAPKILGGDDGVPVCQGKGPVTMKDAFLLERVETRMFDGDILVEGYLP
ncbi:MAG: bifunctional diaminohydroxyphosphoribosylaminopyrimidine deaminase/5-amino-6-(5-phosphoribosylamino)uracil reductase RibD [Desulfobacteraceae bacterium]